jgi:hypothetical protein
MGKTATDISEMEASVRDHLAGMIELEYCGDQPLAGMYTTAEWTSHIFRFALCQELHLGDSTLDFSISMPHF